MLRLPGHRLEFTATTRVVVAFATLVLVVVGAGWVAYRSYGNSRELIDAARQDRRDSLTAERTISRFWKERESMDEYLLAPSNSAAAEVTARRQALERLVSSAKPETQRERNDFALAVKRNATMVRRLDTARRTSRDPAHAQIALRNLRAAEEAVLDPLHDLSALNEAQYVQRESLVRSAGRQALHIELVAAFLALAGIGWFAMFAIGLVRRFGIQNEKLHEAHVQKDEFINTVSHELRTPITSIQGYLELLLDDEKGSERLSAEQRRFLETINRSSVRLLGLVNDLLLVAQARAGRLEMQAEPCDLIDVASNAVEGARATAAKQGLELSFRSSLAVAPTSADAARLGQAIDNLVSNAVKFTPAGGRVDVAVSATADASLITVTDTGMGMSAAEVERLFERFFRTQSARDQNIQGTGLGLAITKTIIEAHGGSVTLTSESGVGTCFTISLPKDTAQPARAPGRAAPARPNERLSTS